LDRHKHTVSLPSSTGGLRYSVATFDVTAVGYNSRGRPRQPQGAWNQCKAPMTNARCTHRRNRPGNVSTSHGEGCRRQVLKCRQRRARSDAPHGCAPVARTRCETQNNPRTRESQYWTSEPHPWPAARIDMPRGAGLCPSKDPMAATRQVQPATLH